MIKIDAIYGTLDKTAGSFYTPASIAEAIVDIAGYKGASITGKRVIDPACGDGALLAPICCRLIQACRDAGVAESQIPLMLADYIYAYELDETEMAKAKIRVVEEAASLGVSLTLDQLVNFHIGDAFDLYGDGIGSFDYVIGNPPYVRIHNLETKPCSRYVEGMCDLYYGFFDLGQQLLSPHGTLCFIAPSSWFTAKAGRLMREDLKERSVISAVCDFGHFEVFAPYAMTYTAIVKIEASPSSTVALYGYEDLGGGENGAVGEVRVSKRNTVDQKRVWVNGLFMPGSPEWMESALNASGDVRVLNGYATNLDQVFMSSKPRFAGSPYEHKCVKASRCDKRYMVYPYDKDGDLVPFDEIRNTSADVADLLENNKDRLLSRTQVSSERWWCFARSQGIADTFHDKVAMQSLVKPGVPVKVASAPAGTGVYGGVYVLGMNENDVEKAVNSDEFFAYAAALRKYKNGGYYALGGKDIEHFLNWWQVRKNEKN